MTFKLYIIIFAIIYGLVLTQYIDEKEVNEKATEQTSVQDTFRQAEIALNRYYYLMKSDIDYLVHAMLHIIIHNPKSVPFVPRRAFNIALKYLEKKLGPNDMNNLIKPLILFMEQNDEEAFMKPSSFQLTDEMKENIEHALDQFFERQRKSSHIYK